MRSPESLTFDSTPKFTRLRIFIYHSSLATSENPEILELNADEELSTRSSKCIAFTDQYLLGGFLKLSVIGYD